MTLMTRPESTEYAPYYGVYVSAVPDGDLLDLLEHQGRDTVTLFRTIAEEKSQFRYAPEKWSIREVVGHMCDTERVFGHRALWFARSSSNELPSMDQNSWVLASNAHGRTMAGLTNEFAAVRAATMALFRSFSEEEFARSGIASGNHVTVRALAYITAGHERHHVKALREKYGV